VPNRNIIALVKLFKIVTENTESSK